jgi:hypothetical protein
MTPEPLKITGLSFIAKRSGLEGAPQIRLWPTNRGPMSVDQMARSKNIKVETLWSRIRKHGHDFSGLLDDVDTRRKPRKEAPAATPRKKPGPQPKPLRREPTSITIGSWERQQLFAERRQGRG